MQGVKQVRFSAGKAAQAKGKRGQTAADLNVARFLRILRCRHVWCSQSCSFSSGAGAWSQKSAGKGAAAPLFPSEIPNGLLRLNQEVFFGRCIACFCEGVAPQAYPILTGVGGSN